ncbi:hypothetical protein ACIPJG_32050 [Streptomyces halstedii]|uniref:hypothetical protein n=1 Tax=Streptomyces halstedii TaxID=1944 RepID=UPI00380E4E38
MTAARKTAAPKTTTDKAKEAETTEEPKLNSFEYKGFTYSVPADPLDLPMEVGLAESEFDLIQEVVGADQWVEFRKSRPSIRQFGEFSELVLTACGYGDSGN